MMWHGGQEGPVAEGLKLAGSRNPKGRMIPGE